MNMLNSGMTQEEVAAGWINRETGKPYAHQHVSFDQEDLAAVGF